LQILNDFVGAELHRGLVVTIGAYDGLHLGHQRLVRALIAHARQIGALSGLITFDPHPRSVLSSGEQTFCLMTVDDKAELLEEMGLDVLVKLPFTAELSRTPAREFVLQAVQHLGMRELWVGAGFALGRDREGDVPSLQRLSLELGFELRVIDTLEDGGESISSSRIRSLIQEGRVGRAGDLLGRPFRFGGRAIADGRRTRLAGLPCFRLVPRPRCLPPAEGVYAANVLIEGQRCAALLTVFASSTDNRGERTVLGYLLESDRDLGGLDGDLILELVRRLDGDTSFGDGERPAVQIMDYARQTQRILRAGADGPG